MSQQPDNQPGAYYVSLINGGKYLKILGPFIDDHAAALAMVEKARIKAEELDNRAFWYAYGTIRLEPGAATPPGVLNRYFPDVCGGAV